MDKIKRNERIGAMARILTASPNHIFTLSHFCGMFDAAKSTISEDIELLRQVYRQFGLGQIETVTGAAGGVKFLPTMVPDKALEYVENLCSRLSDPGRVLPGNFLYIQDILSQPDTLEVLGAIMAAPYYAQNPDFVLTVETKGIPFALMVAQYRMGVKHRQMAMVGDQLYADRMVAALYGIPGLMVIPRGPDLGAQVILKRKWEKKHWQKYYDRGGKTL